MMSFSVAHLLKSVDQWSDIPKKISIGDQCDRTLESEFVDNFQRDVFRVCQMWTSLALTISDVIPQEDGQGLKEFLDINFPNVIGGSTLKMINDITSVSCSKWEVQILDLSLITSPIKNKVIKCHLKMNGQQKVSEVSSQSKPEKVDFFVLDPQTDLLTIGLTKGKNKEIGGTQLYCQEHGNAEDRVLQIKKDSKVVGKLTLRVVLVQSQGPTLLNFLQETIQNDMMDHICRALNLEKCKMESLPPADNLIALEITPQPLGSNGHDVLVFANDIPIPMSSLEPTVVPIVRCPVLYFRPMGSPNGSPSKRRSSLKDLIFSSGLDDDDQTVSLILSQVTVRESIIVNLGPTICSLTVKWTTEGNTPFSVDVDSILRVLVWSKLRILSKDHLMNWFGVLDSLVFQDIQNMFAIMIPLATWNRSKNEALLACHRLIPFNSFLMFEVLTDFLSHEDIKTNQSSSQMTEIRYYLHHAANYLNDSLFAETYENASQIYGSLKCIGILQDSQDFANEFLVPYETILNEKLFRAFFTVHDMKEVLIVFQQRVAPTIIILKDNASILVPSWLNLVSKTVLSHVIPILQGIQDAVPFQVYRSCLFFANHKEDHVDRRSFLDLFRPCLNDWIKMDLDENKQKIGQIVELKSDWLENMLHIREILNGTLQMARDLDWPDTDVQDHFNKNTLRATKELVVFYLNSIQDEPVINLAATVTTTGFWLSFLKSLEFDGILEFMNDANALLDERFEQFLALEKKRLAELIEAKTYQVDYEAMLKRTDSVLQDLFENLIQKVQDNLEHDSIIKDVCHCFYYNELIPKYFSLVQTTFVSSFEKSIKNKLAYPDKRSDLIQSYSDALDELILFENQFGVEHCPKVIQIQEIIQAKFVKASELISKDMEHLHHQIKKPPDESLESRGELRYKIAILEHTRQVVIKLLSLSRVTPLAGGSSANPRISVSLIPHNPTRQHRHLTPIQYDTTCCAFDLLNQDEDILLELPTQCQTNESKIPIFILFELFDHWQLHSSTPVTQKVFRGLSLVRVDQIKDRLSNRGQIFDLNLQTDQLVSIAPLKGSRSKEFQILRDRHDDTCVVHTRRQNYRFQETWIKEIPDALDCVSGYGSSNKLSRFFIESEKQVRHKIGQIRRGFRHEVLFMEIGTTNKVQTNVPKWPLR